MIADTTKVKKLPLEVVNGDVYKYAPPGSSILSLPFVVAASVFGFTPVDAWGAYDPTRELTLSAILAALLMSAFSVVCFKTLRSFISTPWSLAITIGATLGTQVWSAASRVVEPDSWSVLLMMVAINLLVSHEQTKRELQPILLASILSWCYFVHPTGAISIIGIAAYIWFYHRRNFLPFALTGAAWLVLLFIYSWHNFSQVLPNYFRASRLGFQTFWEALAGNLFSPSRGLLIYLPVLVFVLFGLVCYRKFLPFRRLVLLGAIITLLHLLVISGFSHWWAGHSYGPRYWTSMVPWLVLLAGATIQAMTVARDREKENLRWKIQIATGAFLALVSIVIQARGALSEETRLWNAKPYDIDLRAGRLWDWRYPQFLAGLIHPPLPAGAYSAVPLNRPIDFTAEQANNFLWYGWSDPEPQLRWSDEKNAAIVFALDENADLTLIMRSAPFVVTGLKEHQRVTIRLNGEAVESLDLSDRTVADLSLSLPRRLLKRENVLLFDLPDAESPATLGLSNDQRQLGLAVQWIEFRPTQSVVK